MGFTPPTAVRPTTAASAPTIAPMLAFIFAVLLQPIDLDGIGLERARHLHGRLVVTSFILAKPGYTWARRTVLGAADRDDGAEQTTQVRERLDIDQGERVNVLGVLKVRDHKPAVVGGVFVPGWTQLRVAG